MSSALMGPDERARLEARALELVFTLQQRLGSAMDYRTSLLMLAALQLTLEQMGFRRVVPRPGRRKTKPS